MTTTIRRIAVSGSAAVALLGGATAITAASAPAASAAEIQAHIDRAAGAAVNMPDGRTIHIRGLDTAGYSATHEQHSVILAAAKTDATDPAGITTGVTPNGSSGSALQNPYSTGTIPTSTNQQVVTQAGGGAIGVGIVAIIVLGLVVFFRVKNHGLKVGDAVLVGLLGIALSGTFIGAMGTQLTNSAVGSLGSMLSNLG